MRHYWIIAGETSGDIYGARLGRELIEIGRRQGEEVRISGMGGPAMREAGFDIKVDSSELGVMGFYEVLGLLGTFVRIFFRLLKAAAAERPTAVILIDYPGFNLRFAKRLHRLGIPVIWYVSPQVWVWGKRRLPVLAEVCSKMLVIFPFEVEVYRPTGLAAEFVGHPLIDLYRERCDLSIVRDPDLFLLLPGSRKMEVTRLLPRMLATIAEVAKRHPRLRFVLTSPRERITDLCRAMYDDFRRRHPETPPVEIVTGRSAEFQQRAGTGLAASGTVTVEAAIAGLPLVVVYRMNYFTLLIGAVLVKLYRGFFTMTNIIAGRMVYEEFLQWRVAPAHLVPAVERILPGGARRREVEQGMDEVRQLLEPARDSALRQAAESCWSLPADGRGKM